MSDLRSAGLRGLNLDKPSGVLKTLDDYLGGNTLETPKHPFLYGAGISFPMAGNDQYGDCTCAGWYHGAQIAAEIAGVSYDFPVSEVVPNYFRLSGGVDSGLNLSQVVNAASQPGGFLGMEIVGMATVHGIANIQTALYNFGWLYLAVTLPASAEDDFRRGIVWTVDSQSPPVGGHCIIANGTSDTLVTNDVVTGNSVLDIVTWGSDTEATDAWWIAYGVEAIVVIPQWYVTVGHDAIEKLDIAAMQADLKLLQGV